MHGLNKCPELQSLTLQNCGLLAVEGLEKCIELQRLHVEVSFLRLSLCVLNEIKLVSSRIDCMHVQTYYMKEKVTAGINMV